MRNLLTVCFIFFATQVSAADTIMICNSIDGKDYFKFQSPFFGEKTVKEKVNGKWVNWCRENCIDFEVYETGAMRQIEYVKIWDNILPGFGIVANKEYYLVRQTWLDFEFGTRRKKLFIFQDKTKRYFGDSLQERDNTYNCEVQ